MKKLDAGIYLFALGHFCVDWAQGAIPALLPYFVQNYGLSYQEAGSLIFANVLLSSVLQPVFGYYSDKISLPWLIPLGPLFCGLSISLIGFSSSYWTVFGAAMVCGLGSALFHPEAALLVGRIAGLQKGQALSTFSVGGNAGFAVGPLMAGFCAYTLGIRSLLVFGAVNACAVLLIARRLPSALERAKAEAYAGAKSSAPQKANVLGASPEQGTTALSALFVMGAVVTYIGGLAADRAGFVPILRVSFLVMIPAMACFVNSGNVWFSSLLLLPVAVSIFLPYSPIVVLGQAYLGKNAGFASGVTLGLSTTIGGILAPVVGWAADRWGMVTALQILWIAGVFGSLAAFTLREPEKL